MARYERRWWPADPGGLTARERRGGRYRVYLPDPLAGRPFTLGGELAAALDEATGELARLDVTARGLADTEALARLLLRAEAVASSRIEGLVIAPRRLLRAEVARAHGALRDATAAEVLGNIDAMAYTIAAITPGTELRLEHLLDAHRALLASTALAGHSGRIRTRQNWIGGETPAHAAYVPPPAELIPSLLADLIDFCNEQTLPPLPQAAIAHAQFETIHPFADGNGRTGRALIHMVLRARGAITGITPPISLALATNAGEYIAALTAFRHEGDPAGHAMAATGRWLAVFADAVRATAAQVLAFEADIVAMQDAWRARLGRIRADSAALVLLDRLPSAPVLTAAAAAALTGRSVRGIAPALDRLRSAGVLRQTTAGRRNRVFEAPELIEAFALLERRLASPAGDTRIARAARPVPAPPTPKHAELGQ